MFCGFLAGKTADISGIGGEVAFPNGIDDLSPALLLMVLIDNLLDDHDAFVLRCFLQLPQFPAFLLLMVDIQHADDVKVGIDECHDAVVILGA